MESYYVNLQTLLASTFQWELEAHERMPKMNNSWLDSESPTKWRCEKDNQPLLVFNMEWGNESRSAGSLWRMQKAREQIFIPEFRRNSVLTAPQFEASKIRRLTPGILR